MSEQRLQFRVGLFVLTALAVGVGLTIQFGNLQRYFEPRYTVAIEFDDLSGVHPGTPVRQAGLQIGSVTEVSIDREQRKIRVLVEIQQRHRLASDTQPQVMQSLLGEAHIDFSLGVSPEQLRPGATIAGLTPQDPFAAVERLEAQVAETLAVFADTSEEWRHVGKNVNSLIVTNQGSLDTLLEQAAVALQELTTTMQQAATTLEQTNSVLSDPEMQLAVKESVVALPRLIQQTEQTVVQTRAAVGALGKTMENLQTATDPLARNSEVLTQQVAGSLVQLNRTLTQLEQFSTALNEGDGSLQRLTRDPQLYRNLQLSSASLAAVLTNLEPIVDDFRVFSDKVARNPELLGVSGYLKGSSGLKDLPSESPTAPPEIRGRGPFQPASESSGQSFNLRFKR